MFSQDLKLRKVKSRGQSVGFRSGEQTDEPCGGRQVPKISAKSDHGDNSVKKVGFFANFKNKIVNLGRKDTRSQGVIDHIDQVDLLDLAADMGCISAEEQSFTFRPTSSEAPSKGHLQRSDQKRSNGLTFSD